MGETKNRSGAHHLAICGSGFEPVIGIDYHSFWLSAKTWSDNLGRQAHDRARPRRRSRDRPKWTTCPPRALSRSSPASGPGLRVADAGARELLQPGRRGPHRDGAGPDFWTYHGAATTFIGDLGHGQAVAVQMMGQASDYDPRSGRVVTTWRARDPNVEGPGGYLADAEAPGALTFRAPANGTYRFSFSPCAMWGAPGAVKICAR